jgi:hypothetical protein
MAWAIEELVAGWKLGSRLELGRNDKGMRIESSFRLVMGKPNRQESLSQE